MMRDPFLAGQILELTIGERTNNKLYRAQVSQADERNLVLHVPGFDPLGFVDLLKGTGVTLRALWKGEPVIGVSKLAEHFKDSSPYLVVRRPKELFPVRREASARVQVELGAKYAVRAEPTIRPAGQERLAGEGILSLCRVPEPFDLGTLLHLELQDPDGGPFPVEGRVRHIRRDPEDASCYRVDLAVDALDPSLERRLLRAILRPRESAEAGRLGVPGQ
jgi:hypothetical protein